MQTEAVQRVVAWTAVIHSSRAGSSTVPAGAGAAGDEQDVGRPHLGAGVGGDEAEPAHTVGHGLSGALPGEDDLRPGQHAEDLVGADEVEGGEAVEEGEDEAHAGSGTGRRVPGRGAGPPHSQPGRGPGGPPMRRRSRSRFPGPYGRPPGPCTRHRIASGSAPRTEGTMARCPSRQGMGRRGRFAACATPAPRKRRTGAFPAYRVAHIMERTGKRGRKLTDMQVIQSTKLANVCYEIRGPVLEEAMRLEAAGHRILKLNTGNPAAFGFECPPEILEDILRNVGSAHGYGDAKGLLAARRAVMMHYQTLGVETDVEHVFMGNGVSELITMAMQGLLDDGDEVLVPAPDYPLWTASVSLAGGTAVHYRCDEESDWMPDLADIERKITDRTKALVIINPNNPTGAVYSDEMLRSLTDIARRHNLLVCSDEIYDKILYDGATHTPRPPPSPRTC